MVYWLVIYTSLSHPPLSFTFFLSISMTLVSMHEFSAFFCHYQWQSISIFAPFSTFPSRTKRHTFSFTLLWLRVNNDILTISCYQSWANGRQKNFKWNTPMLIEKQKEIVANFHRHHHLAIVDDEGVHVRNRLKVTLSIDSMVW
jgi:hypothetical protein